MPIHRTNASTFHFSYYLTLQHSSKYKIIGIPVEGKKVKGILGGEKKGEILCIGEMDQYFQGNGPWTKARQFI